MNIANFTDYLRGQDRANRTLNGYKRDLEAFNTWYEQSYDQSPETAGITPLDIRAYKKHLAETRQMKPASINRRLAALRAYFRWACESGFIATNPTDGIRDVGQVTRAPRWLDRKQTFALLQAATSGIQLAEAKGLTPTAHLARRDAAIVALLLNAGLRVSELCALRLADVTLTDRRGLVVVRSGKGNKYREIPLNRDAREALRRWLAVRPAGASDYFFIGRRQEALQPRGVERVIARLANVARLPAGTVTPLH